LNVNSKNERPDLQELRYLDSFQHPSTAEPYFSNQPWRQVTACQGPVGSVSTCTCWHSRGDS